MNDQKKIALLSILLTFIFIIIIFNIIYIFYLVNYEEGSFIAINDFKLYFYGDLSDAYENDEEVIKVYELCWDSEIKSICVHENIEFFWSKSFEVIRKDYFFSPTEMVKNNGRGICRDIAVFRMAVLKKLNIPAKFVFIPEHVYVRAFEKGKIYELDNGVIRVK